MAGTFRDFLSGLASAAPQVAQLAYNYTLYKDESAVREREMQMREREVAVSEKTAESQANYYAAQEEATREATAFNKATTNIRQQLLNIEFDIKDTTARMAKKDLNAFDDRLAADLELAKANTEKLYSDIRTNEDEVIYRKTMADIARLSTSVDMLGALQGLSKSPEDEETLSQIFNDSGGDPSKFYAALSASDVKFSNPATKEYMMRTHSALSGMLLEARAAVGENAIETYRHIMSGDAKYEDLGKALRKGGIDYEKMSENEFAEIALRGYDESPFVERIRSAHSSLEKNMGISLNLFGEPEQEEGATVGVGDVLGNLQRGMGAQPGTGGTSGVSTAPRQRTENPYQSFYAPYGSDPTRTNPLRGLNSAMPPTTF